MVATGGISITAAGASIPEDKTGNLLPFLALPFPAGVVLVVAGGGDCGCFSWRFTCVVSVSRTAGLEDFGGGSRGVVTGVVVVVVACKYFAINSNGLANDLDRQTIHCPIIGWI